MGPRSEIREIERNRDVRTRGPAASSVRRGLDARGLRDLREMTRAQSRYSAPSSLPLTQTGWMVVLLAVGLLLIAIAVALILHLR